MTLCELGAGDSAEILELRQERPLRIRLMELGMTPGTRVALLCTAPAGDPMVFRLHGYDLVLRRCDAAGVIVHREIRRAPSRKKR